MHENQNKTPGTATAALIEPPLPVEPSQGQEIDAPQRNVWKTVGIVLAVLLVLVVGISIFLGLATHPKLTAILRDVSIIVLALVTMITSIFLAILLFQLQSLIVLLRDEVQPILESMNETAGTVRGTTTFVSDAVVTPMITVASYVSAAKTTVKTLFGSSGGSGPSRQQPISHTSEDVKPQSITTQQTLPSNSDGDSA